MANCIAFARLDGAPISSIRIAANKAWTAARERKSTREIGEKARHPEKGFDIAYFGDHRFVGWGGGVPVWRNGQVVGAVAVSGLPEEEDIKLAEFGAGLVEGTVESAEIPEQPDKPQAYLRRERRHSARAVRPPPIIR